MKFQHYAIVLILLNIGAGVLSLSFYDIWTYNKVFSIVGALIVTSGVNLTMILLTDGSKKYSSDPSGNVICINFIIMSLILCFAYIFSL